MKKIYLFLIIVLTACRPSTSEDFQSEGKAWMKSCLKELKEIKTLDDLNKKQAFIQKKYNQLAELILLANLKEPQQELDLIENMESKELHSELMRIYLIPGAKEVIASIQLETLKKLNGIDRRVE
ncbi:MAG: hypothetical protein COT84_08765 [Chlamydiae bacterium CG10_big_fil_rev_8_21_14_0_10_35_9]|nr:MAG: hypothetical protein COT84_08765 [Chlamydiae bacterium CG10_big_fil_rev_8_21_14_0_10_35_9]